MAEKDVFKKMRVPLYQIHPSAGLLKKYFSRFITGAHTTL